MLMFSSQMCCALQAGVEAQSKVTELVPMDTKDDESEPDQVMKMATSSEAAATSPITKDE